MESGAGTMCCSVNSAPLPCCRKQIAICICKLTNLSHRVREYINIINVQVKYEIDFSRNYEKICVKTGIQYVGSVITGMSADTFLT